jgi:TetR/AcrR family transcriptional regulator, transcriptional repressor of bet genes
MNFIRSNKDQRRERGDEARRLLVQAAITSVAKFGLAGTTLTTVAELSGFSRALVGFHFKSKDQLLLDALDASLATYDDSLRQALKAAPSDPKAQLLASLMHDVALISTHPELLSLWSSVWGEANGVDLYRVSVLPTDRRYRIEIAASIEQIVKDKEVARKRATILQAFVFGIWLDYHLDPKSFNHDDAREAALTLLDAVTATKTASRTAAKANNRAARSKSQPR